MRKDSKLNVIFPLVYKVARLLEDPIGLNRPCWRDYSKYDTQVDFQVAAANGVRGAAFRSGISWGYQDAWFPQHWSASEGVLPYRTSYHVPYPDQPLVAQADNWYRVHPRLAYVPRVIDLELDRAQPYDKIATFVWDLSELVKSRDGIRPIIYSRYMLINLWLASWTEEMINDHYWWLAQYLYDRTREHAGPPTLATKLHRDRVILHQTADKKPPFPGETAALAVDWDRWEIGNDSEMVQWISDHWGMPLPPPPMTLEEKVNVLYDYAKNTALWDIP